MEINRTGSRNNYPEPSQKVDQATHTFKQALVSPDGTDAPVDHGEISSAVSRAELADPQKTEQVVRAHFHQEIDRASSELGVRLTDAQQQQLLEYLQNDPMMRAKLLTYLNQTGK